MGLNFFISRSAQLFSHQHHCVMKMMVTMITKYMYMYVVCMCDHVYVSMCTCTRSMYICMSKEDTYHGPESSSPTFFRTYLQLYIHSILPMCALTTYYVCALSLYACVM